MIDLDLKRINELGLRAPEIYKAIMDELISNIKIRVICLKEDDFGMMVELLMNCRVYFSDDVYESILWTCLSQSEMKRMTSYERDKKINQILNGKDK